MTGTGLARRPGLPPTEKLFHDDPCLDEATARVVAVDGPQVVLDRTVFYAESGGQVADTGFLGPDRVVDVSKHGGTPVRVERDGLDPLYVDDGTFFVHHLAAPASVAVGDTVRLSIDGDRRRRLMRSHSAAHFLYVAIDAVVRARLGERIVTRGALIREDGFRFDLFNAVGGDMVAAIEETMNALIREGRPIGIERSTACDDVKYWIYGEHVVPCGGTHVRSAADLPELAVRRRSKGKRTVRLYCDFGDAG